jgi:predicted O-linked N-acetylglucosamine transferase (SPINDLY family)
MLSRLVALWRRRRAHPVPAAEPQALYREGVELEDARRFDDAERRYRRALELEPGLAKAHNNLGVLLDFRGRDVEAAEHFRRAIASDPALPQPLVNLGNLLQRGNDLDAAADCYRAALVLDSGNVEAQGNLANILLERGEHAAARAAYARAAELAPASAVAASNRLAFENYSDGVTPAAQFQAHLDWGRRFAAPLARPHANWPNPPDPDRRLRLGYVSPDFRQHAMSAFVGPLLEFADTAAFELFCYNDTQRPDAFTARLRKLTLHWRDTATLDDAALARLIAEDRVDVLVDLAGHTSHGRLLAFARQPAPVQLAYLGYVNTSGVTAVGYRITDAIADLPGASESRYVERLLRLPHSIFGYRPPHDAPAVGPLPALNRGNVSFGSFNNFAKITRAVSATWARLLSAVPRSRLIMLSVARGETQKRTLEAFAGHGIDPARVEFHARLAAVDYLRMHNRVDIALDPFPFNGGATTCNALWMGVPVLTLAGDVFAGRTGLSLLSAIGLPELAARDGEDYVRIAHGLAADLPRLAELRAGLRKRMRTSPVCDLPQFVADIERLYRGAWRRWCAAGV